MKNVKSFRSDLVNWFNNNKRILPWRENKNPYFVWVSEVMLQQTKVDTVIPFFNNFIKKFPTVTALANANEQEVLKAWEGLGYYSRARNLQKGAKEVVNIYQGVVPDSLEKISKISGIGPYTAGAILSIAYGKKEPAVDGNVMRVMSRVLLIKEDIAKQKTRKVFEEKLYEIIDPKNTSSFNQGLMELGALICTPTKPKCESCPVQNSCLAFKENIQETLPIKSKKKKADTFSIKAIMLINDKGELIIEKRPEMGLLANLWQFPNIEEEDFEKAKTQIAEKFGIKIKNEEKLTNIKHIFTHLKWDIDVYFAGFKGEIFNSDRVKIVSLKEIEKYPFPVSHQKMLQAYKKKS